MPKRLTPARGTATVLRRAISVTALALEFVVLVGPRAFCGPPQSITTEITEPLNTPRTTSAFSRTFRLDTCCANERRLGVEIPDPGAASLGGARIQRLVRESVGARYVGQGARC